MTNLNKAIELYNQGLSVRKIARIIGIDHSHLSKKLHKNYSGYKKSSRELPANERFFLSVYPEPNTGCWLWGGGPKNNARYGTISVSGKDIPAHRFSYQMHYGKIPTGMHVCHKCDVTFCVNPEHLFLGTHRDNMHDMSVKGRGGRHSSLTKQDIQQILELRKAGMSVTEISVKFGIHNSYASRLSRGLYKSKSGRLKPNAS